MYLGVTDFPTLVVAMRALAPTLDRAGRTDHDTTLKLSRYTHGAPR